MDIIQMIQAFGFPIVACCSMAWYVKYITDQNNSRIDDMHREHRAEVDRLAGVLENNTLAIQKLTDYITHGQDSARE